MKRGRTQSLYGTFFRHRPKMVDRIDELGQKTKERVSVSQAFSDRVQAGRQIESAYQKLIDAEEWLDKCKQFYAEFHQGHRYRKPKSTT